MRQWQLIACVLLPFSAGYFLTYAFRTINSVISQQLVAEMGLDAAQLGLLTSVFFLSFVVVQLPLGACLDRFGPRRVQIVSLPIAALGALVTCFVEQFRWLLFGRALIGVGVASALMAGLKAIALWVPRENVALANGALVTLGSLGAIATTTPAAELLPLLEWRGLFGGLAAVAVGTVVLTWLLVPEAPSSQEQLKAPSSRSVLSRIYKDRYFWRLAPLSTACVSASWSLQGIWAARWLSEVEGLEQTEVVNRLFVMAIAISAGALLFGLVAHQTRGRIAPALLLATVAAASITSQVSLIMRWPLHSYLLWVPIAAAGASTVLSFSALAQHVSSEIAGRANAALNTMHVSGAFLLQLLTGVIIQRQLEQGHSPVVAFQVAFAAGAAVQVAALLWYLLSARGEKSSTAQLDGKEAHYQRPATVEANARRWKLVAIGSALCSALTLFNLISSGPGLSGQTNRVALPRMPMSVADRLAEHILVRFVENIRSLSTDPVVVRSRWIEASAFLTDKAARELTDEVHKTKLFSIVGNHAIAVEVTYVAKLSESDFQIRWNETAYPRDGPVETNRFVAKVLIVPGAAPNNPFGVCIDAFFWSREVPVAHGGVWNPPITVQQR